MFGAGPVCLALALFSQAVRAIDDMRVASSSAASATGTTGTASGTVNSDFAVALPPAAGGAPAAFTEVVFILVPRNTYCYWSKLTQLGVQQVELRRRPAFFKLE